MSIDTHLVVSSKWSLDQIKDVMESYLDLKETKKRKKNIAGKFYTIKRKVDIQPTDNQPNCYNFFFEINGSSHGTRRMFVITNNDDNPIGPTTWMSLGHNEESIMIMRAIAAVLGGVLEESDCDCNLENISGKLSTSNGLPYFIQYALLNNKMSDEDDLIGLIKCISQWESEHASSGNYHKSILTKELLDLIMEG